MKQQRFVYLITAVLVGGLALVGCKKPAPVTPEVAPVVETAAPVAPVAFSVVGIAVGNTEAADKSVAALATLAAGDQIIVSVKTDGVVTGAAIAAKLTYEDGQVAGEQGVTIDTNGPETTNVAFTNTSPWPAGGYKAEVFVNGQLSGTAQSFTVQ